MKYLKNFNLHTEYQEYILDGELPNVSYCIDNDEVHYSSPKYIIVKYNVTDNNPVKLVNRPEIFNIANIDGTNITIPNNGEYQFQTSGEHIVKYLTNKDYIDEYLFEGCSNITNVVLPNTITVIEDYTFKNCINLQSIQIKNVIGIGNSTFEGCSELHSINLSNVQIIAYSTFKGCSKLSEVDISSLQGELLNSVFKNSGLVSITIPNTVTSIGESAFEGSNLTNIIIPNTVTSIGNNAFKNCYKLLSIDIPSNIVSIGQSAFSNDYMLRYVNIYSDSKLQSIGDNAFYLCSSLDQFNISKPVPPTIGQSVFGMTLCNITVPTEYENDYVNAWSDYHSSINKPITATINVQDVNTTYKLANNISQFDKIIVGDTEVNTDTYQFETTGNYSVRYKISNNNLLNETFKNCTGITTISLPSNVKTLGNSVFEGCTNLSSARIPNSVTSVGTSLFKNCTSLIKVKNIDISSDSNKDGTVELSRRITVIPDSIFEGCTNINEIEIQDTVTTIGNNAYKGTKPTNITIPESVTSIAINAFENVNNLKNITINSQIVSNNYTLQSNLSTIFGTGNNRCYYINNVASIGNYAFALDSPQESRTIKEIHLSPSVRLIGDHAFYNNITNKLSIEIPYDLDYTPVTINDITDYDNQEDGTIDLHLGTISTIWCEYGEIEDVDFMDSIDNLYNDTWGKLKKFDGTTYSFI